MGSSGPTHSTTTTSTALPAWLQPYAQQFIQSYQGQVFDPNTGQLNTPTLPQQGVANFTPDQIAAMDQIRAQAPQAQALAGTGANQLGATLSGQYLDPSTNPYLTDTYNIAARGMSTQFSQNVLPGIQAAAARAGQFGSSAMNQAMAGGVANYQQGLNDLATQIYGGNYQAERARQLQAQQFVPQTMASMYQPAQALYGVGAAQQGLQQQQMDVGYQNQIAQMEMPYQLLSGFGGALGQAGSGAGSSTTSMRGAGGGK